MTAGHVASSSASSEPRQNEPRQPSAPERARRGAPSGARRRRWTAAFGIVAVGGILLVAGVTVYAERSILYTAGAQLGHLEWGWLLLGIVCEFVSMLAFALLQRRLLLTAGATRLPLVALLATAYKANAIYLGVPVFGSGMATSYACRQFQKQGVTPATTGLALGVAGIFSTMAFTLVVALGALVSGNAVSAVPRRDRRRRAPCGGGGLPRQPALAPEPEHAGTGAGAGAPPRRPSPPEAHRRSSTVGGRGL